MHHAFVRESSLKVTKTNFSGLQQHRTIVYTATGQKAKPKVHMSTETTDTGDPLIPFVLDI
jgi:hypothetical protein